MLVRTVSDDSRITDLPAASPPETVHAPSRSAGGLELCAGCDRDTTTVSGATAAADDISGAR